MWSLQFGGRRLSSSFTRSFRLAYLPSPNERGTNHRRIYDFEDRTLAASVSIIEKAVGEGKRKYTSRAACCLLLPPPPPLLLMIQSLLLRPANAECNLRLAAAVIESIMLDLLRGRRQAKIRRAPRAYLAACLEHDERPLTWAGKRFA